MTDTLKAPISSLQLKDFEEMDFKEMDVEYLKAMMERIAALFMKMRNEQLEREKE